jgi:hypothetical protein
MNSSDTLTTKTAFNSLHLSVRLITFGLTISLFGLFSGTIYFWDASQFTISPAFSYSLLFAALPLLIGVVMYYRTNTLATWTDFYLCPNTACFGLVMVFFSDWLSRGFNLFQGPMIRGELLAIFILLLIFLRFFSKLTFFVAAISACLILYTIFIFLSDGHPIISDDHASFIFRITLLKDYFPNIPIYHPFWNAGLDARDFFATGAIGFFLLTAPLHYLFAIADSYNFAVGFVLFIVLPLSLAYATKLARVAAPGPAIASILGLATSLVWYRWSLKYGTMGFVTSAALMPTVFVLGCRLINDEKLSKLQFILFVIATSLACMWPLGGVCYIALVVVALFRLKFVLKNKQIFLAGFLLILINLPWAALFWKVSQVGNFLQAPRSAISTENQTTQVAITEYRHKNNGFDLKKALKILREQANGTNPLILFLFLPGLSLLAREFRKPFIIQTLLLLIGGTLIVTIKPQLELDRLLVFLSILLTIPSARALTTIFENLNRSIILPSVAFSFLILSPWITSNVLHNRSAESYNFSKSLPDSLSSALQKYVSNGRAVFSGFVLHELEGGHVAPLVGWSDKPLVASSPFHNKWKYTSVFPTSFVERGQSGILEFLDLMNAEVVLAHEAHWRNFFMNLPDLYELVWQQRPFLMFKKKSFVSNYFISGQGEIIEQTANSVHFKLRTSEAVIKFSYFPFLIAGTCTLKPFDVGLDIPFIQLSNCPTETELVLHSVGPLQRLLQ